MSSEPFGDLLTKIRALCQFAIAEHDESAEALAVLEREVAALCDCRGGEAFSPSQVQRHLPSALAHAKGTPAEGLADADTIIGPLGDQFTSGITGGATSQIAIRSEAVGAHLHQLGLKWMAPSAKKK